MIKFPATIHRVAVDAEGEGTLTLKVPSSDLAPVVRSLSKLKKLIEVTIEDAPHG